MIMANVINFCLFTVRFTLLITAYTHQDAIGTKFDFDEQFLLPKHGKQRHDDTYVRPLHSYFFKNQLILASISVVALSRLMINLQSYATRSTGEVTGGTSFSLHFSSV